MNGEAGCGNPRLCCARLTRGDASVVPNSCRAEVALTHLVNPHLLHWGRLLLTLQYRLRLLRCSRNCFLPHPVTTHSITLTTGGSAMSFPLCSSVPLVRRRFGGSRASTPAPLASSVPEAPRMLLSLSFEDYAVVAAVQCTCRALARVRKCDLARGRL